MAVAFVAAFPVGISEVIGALSSPELILAGIGVGLCSSVIPYVSDQLAMSRLPRATFALMLALLPATAPPSARSCCCRYRRRDMLGIALVMGGVAVHKQRPVRPRRRDDRHAPIAA